MRGLTPKPIKTSLISMTCRETSRSPRIRECFHVQDKLVQSEVRLAAAIESLNAEELKLDEKQKELDEVQAAYDAQMQQRQVRLSD